MSRKPRSETLLTLPEVPPGTPVGELLSLPQAARRIGVHHSTLYDAVSAGRLRAFGAANLGDREPLRVVLVADVTAFAATLKPDKRRGDMA